MSKQREKIQIVVVCEDNAHAVLIRNYLDRIGYNRRKLRFMTNPSGRGAGEQFVRKTYPSELDQYRKRNPQYWRLVVVIDADVNPTLYREQQLADEAVAHGLAPRQKGEGVVHLIPKRNVETWVHQLLGQPADEGTDYKLRYTKQPENAYCRPAAEALASLVRDVNRQPDLPSLVVAVQELREKLSESP